MNDLKIDFSIVIPAYNEAAAIGAVLRRLVDGLRDRNYELLVVDDGSSDQTAEQAAEVDPHVRVVRHPYNMGNGAAIKTGIRQARGEILVFMDADGQHRPEDIPRLLQENQRYDMVVGARSKASQAGWHRSMANGVYNHFASYVTGRHIGDLTSGFRSLRRDVARRFISLLPNGFSYPTTLTLCLMRAGFSVNYIPIEAAQRQGKSKIKLLADGTKFLLVVGCGIGYLCGLGREEGAQVYGMDKSLDALHYAAATVEGKFAAASADGLPFRSDSFDKIIFADVIEHVPDDHKVLEKIVRVAKPGARIVVSTPALALK
jgi:glycosyltransferase involved in cell wall biosynthesis